MSLPFARQKGQGGRGARAVAVASVAVLAMIVAATLLSALAGPAMAQSGPAAADEAAQACPPDDSLDLRGPWGQARITIEIADEPAERARGLMNRESLPRMSGMLFVYDRPQAVAFWMKNTLIPLDMIFADETGRVVRVHEMARPLDETPIPGGESIQYVLEINGGMAAILGIAPGTELRHRRISPGKAAWPCAAP